MFERIFNPRSYTGLHPCDLHYEPDWESDRTLPLNERCPQVENNKGNTIHFHKEGLADYYKLTEEVTDKIWGILMEMDDDNSYEGMEEISKLLGGEGDVIYNYSGCYVGWHRRDYFVFVDLDCEHCFTILYDTYPKARPGASIRLESERILNGRDRYC